MRAALLLCLTFSVNSGEASQPQSKSRADDRPIRDAVNNPVWAGATPPAVLRAQILLDRAHFSPGEIDSHPGANFDRALKAFQLARKIPVTGIVDEPTWLALNIENVPALMTHVLTEQNLPGPFQRVPEDMMAKAKLKYLGYAGPEEALGEQFHLSPALLRQMNPGKRFQSGEEILVPNVLTTPGGQAAGILVTRSGSVTAVDESGNFLAHYPCSSGSEHDPLPKGKWEVTGIYPDPPFHYNPALFWDANPSHSKARIAPGPNNPVGVVWIDLTKEHFGIHGTPEPSKVGHTQSHGCIRLTNWDARELAGMVMKGMIAELE